MKLTNDTPLVADQTLAFRGDGRELLVVVAKGTFVLVDRTNPGAEPRFAEEQVPLLMADEFGDDPAKNAPLTENDFAPVKPECDVVLQGSAYAPQGRHSKIIGVGMRVGPVSKSFNVTGRRYWKANLAGNVAAGEPDPIAEQPISYDVAFGGIEVDPKDPERADYYLANPAGRGYRKRNLEMWGQLMPQTEEISDPIRDPKKPYRPMAFGPLGRNWKPRLDYVGTYDQKWMDEVAPFLPADFNPLHFQAAPPDQRMPYPRGGEPIRLVNLLPPGISADGSAQNALPTLRVAMVFLPARGDDISWVDANLDTVLIQPDHNRFTCTWRASHAAKRDATEIAEVVVCIRDTESDGRLRARLAGKEYYHGLGELARARKGGGR